MFLVVLLKGGFALLLIQPLKHLMFEKGIDFDEGDHHEFNERD
jgi:hypothetical protein